MTRALRFLSLPFALLALLALPTPLLAAPPDTATLDDAAKLETDVERLDERGRYDDALPLAERVVTIREKLLGPTDARVASALSALGATHLLRGDFARAEPLLSRAVTLLDGTGHDRELASALDNLAALFAERGESAKAQPLYERAVAVQEKAAGPDDPDLGGYLANLAMLRLGNRDYGGAESLLARARSIHQKAGRGHSESLDLQRLGVLYRSKGDYGRAVDAYNAALVLSRKDLSDGGLGAAHLAIAIADLQRGQKQLDVAEPLYAEGEATLEKVLGPTHPAVAKALAAWSLGRQAANDPARAVALRARANAIEERHLSLVLASGSDADKQAFATTLATGAETTVALHVWSASSRPDAGRLALTTILQRKGRVLDATSGGLSALRRHLASEDRALVDELVAARGELSTLTVRGPEGGDPASFKAHITKLVDRARAAEVSVSARSAAFRAAEQPVSLEAVQAAIPSHAALVEIYRYRYRDAKAYSDGVAFGTARYVAYVLRHDGEPTWVSFTLDADSIDRMVAELRTKLASQSKDFDDVANRLAAVTFRRLMPLLGEAREIFLSADGALSLIPFGALVDESGKHLLVERFTFTYLTSGRDLLRFGARSPSREPPLVIGNPDYEATGPIQGISVPGSPTRGGQRSSDLSQLYFTPLPGTEAEAKAVSGALPGARLLTGAAATEAAVKAVRAPAILHIATHGFFMTNQSSAPTSSRGRAAGRREPVAPLIENPLLRSGLALAGANALASGDDDGVLTALEATGLDLHGTKLVVLSACETGVGEIKNGEGVYGLRRALVIAGAETQVISLWKVNDDATRTLMTAYYAKLREGTGRSEALRQVQLQMLASTESAGAHPFSWAGFIVSGDPGPLWEADAAPSVIAGGAGKVAPGARGCGCEVGGTGNATDGVATAIVMGLAARRRRRGIELRKAVVRSGQMRPRGLPSWP